MYPEYTSFVRDAIDLRYRLMPYYYSLMYQAHCTGLPILQPLCCAYQQDPRSYDEAETFAIGSLLVSTVVEKGAKTKTIYFPKGQKFYDFYTRKCYEGGQTVEVPVYLSSIPMYLSSGTILPMTNTIAHNMTTDVVKDLHIICIADKDGSFELYEDDGCTNEYKNGVFKKTHIDMTVDKQIVLTFTAEGSYQSPVENIELDVVYPQNAPFAVLLNGQPLPHFLYNKKYEQAKCGWYYNLTTKSIEIKYPTPAGDYKVVILTDAMDVIGM